MAEAIYWRSSSWTWSKGCKKPPGCSSKVIIKFSIIMFLFFHMSCNFLTYCFPIQMRWLLEYLHFLGLYVLHALYMIYMLKAHHPLFYCIGTTRTIWSVSMSLCLGSHSQAFQDLTFISQWHVGSIWVIGMWIRVVKSRGSRMGTQILKFLVLNWYFIQ